MHLAYNSFAIRLKSGERMHSVLQALFQNEVCCSTCTFYNPLLSGGCPWLSSPARTSAGQISSHAKCSIQRRYVLPMYRSCQQFVCLQDIAFSTTIALASQNTQYHMRNAVLTGEDHPIIHLNGDVTPVSLPGDHILNNETGCCLV